MIYVRILSIKVIANFLPLLIAYQLAISHRQPDETILLQNQACKDLSNGNWNVALIAYHFLFYTQTNETFASDVLYLIQNEATRRSALNSLLYQSGKFF